MLSRSAAQTPGNMGEFTSEMYERCQAQGGSGDGLVLAISCEGVWQQTDQDMVEKGTDAILGAEPIMLQPAHLGTMRVLRRIAGCINGIDTDGVGQPHQSNRAVPERDSYTGVV